MKEKAENAWNMLKCVLSFWLIIGLISGLFNRLIVPFFMTAFAPNPQYGTLQILAYLMSGGGLLGLAIGLMFWLYLVGTKSKSPEVMREMAIDLGKLRFSEKKED
ncbi:MAG: hypothetical protein NTX82_06230 [Candidatus Parcubacteria bacterium]|nr:hypothetical protein [Candidatus Parcubacteria bacterium]